MVQNRTILILSRDPDSAGKFRSSLGPLAEDCRVTVFSGTPDASATMNASGKTAGRVPLGLFDLSKEELLPSLELLRSVREKHPDFRLIAILESGKSGSAWLEGIAGVFQDRPDLWLVFEKPVSETEVFQASRLLLTAWGREVITVPSESLESIKRIARGMGHELGNLLLRIMGKGDLALMEDESVGRIHEHLQVLMRAAERVSLHVRNLQMIAQLNLNPEPGSVSELLEEAIREMEGDLERYKIRLERSTGEIPVLFVDPNALRQVFLNLLLNSLQAMPQGGTLAINAAPAKGPDGKAGVLVQVRDSGSGISPEDLPRVFDVSFTTKGGRGSGLGLAVSREVVTGLHGRISVASEPGKWTEVSVWLPQQ